MRKRIFTVWKPKGPTSHDIVDAVRRVTGERRVGHAGTLDPLAEGVLVIGVGKEATTSLSEEVAKEKEYIAVILLGSESSTDDAEGEKTEIATPHIPDKKKVVETLKKFKGIIEQVPPVYSAVKVKGKTAYAFAREGKKIDLKPRTVEIKQIELLEYEWPHLTLRVVTGPGVYIRSLARDLARVLGTGGYIGELKRTRVGEFSMDSAIPVDKLKEFWDKNFGTMNV